LHAGSIPPSPTLQKDPRIFFYLGLFSYISEAMKPLKKKLDRKEFYIDKMKKVGYKKFVKSTLLQRRKQKNINS
jgi:hypothetical protein